VQRQELPLAFLDPSVVQAVQVASTPCSICQLERLLSPALPINPLHQKDIFTGRKVDEVEEAKNGGSYIAYGKIRRLVQ
jgi:hypothetical protein